jgi:hypothetical protein
MLPALPIYAMFVFGLVAEGGCNAYTKSYTIGQAIQSARAVGLAYGLAKPEFWFVPISLAVPPSL